LRARQDERNPARPQTDQPAIAQAETEQDGLVALRRRCVHLGLEPGALALDLHLAHLLERQPAAGGRGAAGDGRLAVGAPALVADGAATWADPLPQALVLTAIVIGFATTGFVLELALRTRDQTGTDHVDGAEPNAKAPDA
jgi:hypothetical protein